MAGTRVRRVLTKRRPSPPTAKSRSSVQKSKRRREESTIDDQKSKRRSNDKEEEKSNTTSSSVIEIEDETVVIDLGNPNKHWKAYPRVNKSILRDELMKCQLCCRVFPRIQDAIQCLSSHSGTYTALRCYCCFKIFVGNAKASSTRQLRQHYEEEHNAENETIRCPYCPRSRSLPFPAVSAHIVGTHGPRPEEQAERANEGNITEPVSYKFVKKSLPNFPVPNTILKFVNPNRIPRCYC